MIDPGSATRVVGRRLRRFALRTASPRSSVRPVDGESGLTLVEMIVALALGAMVIAFLAQGTGLLRAFTRIEDALSVEDEILAVRDHLRGTLASALTGGSGVQRNVVAGVGDTLVFTVPGDRLLETGGLVRVTLAAVPEGRFVSLAETRAPIGGSEGANRTRRLVEGAAGIRFSYYGALSGDAAPSWVSEWTDPETSPQLVRIDVRFPPGDGRRWPPFVVFIPSGGAPNAGTPSSGGAPPTARNGPP